MNTLLAPFVGSLLLLLCSSNAALAAEPPATTARAADADVAPREPADRRFHIGGGVVGGVAAVDGAAAPFYEWRTETAVNLGEGVSVGIAHMIGLGAGPQLAAFVHGTPFVEVAGFVGPRVQPFGRVGVLIRGRADSGDDDRTWFEAAPYAGGGARAFVTRALSVGIEAGAHLVLTEELTVGEARLPRWSVPATATISTAVHF